MADDTTQGGPFEISPGDHNEVRRAIQWTPGGHRCLPSVEIRLPGLRWAVIVRAGAIEGRLPGFRRTLRWCRCSSTRPRECGLAGLGHSLRCCGHSTGSWHGGRIRGVRSRFGGGSRRGGVCRRSTAVRCCRARVLRCFVTDVGGSRDRCGAGARGCRYRGARGRTGRVGIPAAGEDERQAGCRGDGHVWSSHAITSCVVERLRESLRVDQSCSKVCISRCSCETVLPSGASISRVPQRTT